MDFPRHSLFSAISRSKVFRRRGRNCRFLPYPLEIAENIHPVITPFTAHKYCLLQKIFTDVQITFFSLWLLKAGKQNLFLRWQIFIIVLRCFHSVIPWGICFPYVSSEMWLSVKVYRVYIILLCNYKCFLAFAVIEWLASCFGELQLDLGWICLKSWEYGFELIETRMIYYHWHIFRRD